MNLRDLRYLVAVAEHRHFGRAAAACFVSQPTLSTQIKKLETELGVELIERSPRHIRMTAAGEAVIERAQIMLREADNIVDIARHMKDPSAGVIRLGMFPTLGPYLLPHVIPQIRDQFPNLKLQLVEEKSDEILRQLRNGDLDAVLLARPVSGDDLESVSLFAEDFVLAVPDDHTLAKQSGPVPASVLQDHDVLLLTEGHCLRDQALAVCQMTGGTEYSGFRATSLETLRQMVAAGAGITLLPNLSVQPPVPQPEHLTLVPFAEPVPSRDIAMFWRKTTPLQDFLTEMAQIFRQLPSNLVTPA